MKKAYHECFVLGRRECGGHDGDLFGRESGRGGSGGDGMKARRAFAVKVSIEGGVGRCGKEVSPEGKTVGERRG